MSRRPAIETNSPFENLWIIHTFRPFYSINKSELDPEYARLKKVVSGGIEAIEKDVEARRLKVSNLAAESLPFSEERAAKILWARADENGDFYVRDGHVAAQIMHELRRDPEPKPVLDPKSPPLPSLHSDGSPKEEAETQVPAKEPRKQILPPRN